MSEKLESVSSPGSVFNGLTSPEYDDELHDEKRNQLFNRRLDMRVLPICCWIYLLNYLDRGNVGNAKVLNEETKDDMLSQTGMSAFDYSLAVTLFSVAYALFEVPSNWVMKHYVRPSLWLGLLLVTWGVLTVGFSGVHNFATVLALRILIGVVEAGFFPGLLFVISIWYRHDERALRVAFITAFANLAGAFGGSIAFGIGNVNGARGLQGFRWLFIIEGLITIISVLPVVFCLPDYPARARFLSDEDKKFAEDRLKARGGGYNKTHASRNEVLATIFKPRMLAHYIAYIANCVQQGSFIYFTPTIVTGLGFNSIQAQLLTVPPWVVGFFAALLLSWSADHFKARGLHTSIGSLAGAAGWLAAGLLPPDAYIQRYGCLCLAAVGAFPVSPAMVCWVMSNTPSLLTIPLAIAMHNSMAGAGQLIAQWIWIPSEAAIGYPTGNFVCASCAFFVSAVTAVLRLTYGYMNVKGVKDSRGEDRVWSY